MRPRPGLASRLLLGVVTLWAAGIALAASRGLRAARRPAAARHATADAADTDRERATTAVLAEAITVAEAFERRYAEATRDRASSDRDATSLDSLARETLRESEEARTRIAHSLHDTAAQSMVSAHRFLEAARGSLDGGHAERVPAHLAAAQERVSGAIREIRSILNTLVPPGLEELGIGEALRIHVRDGVPRDVATEVTGDLPRLEGWLEAGLFAMAAEAVGNAVLHARARTIRVDLRGDGSRAVITVTDDGIGFDPAAAARHTEQGMGIVGITRRASWLGGSVAIESTPGTGTTVRIDVPIANGTPETRDETAIWGGAR